MLLCRVCNREIAKGCVFIIKHVRIAGRDAWMPVHCGCNAALIAGRAKLHGGTLSSPPGHTVGDGLMLPIKV
jgi:hypothetical protein